MNVKSKKTYHEINYTLMVENLRNIAVSYKEKTKEAWRVLTYANDMLYFKRQKPDQNMSDIEYNRELKAIVNMGIIYFCALYESYTRDFFKSLLIFKDGMEENEFEDKYYKFTSLKRDIMEKRFKIFLNSQFKDWSFISKIYHDRGCVAHRGADFRPNFKILEFMRNNILNYISFIETAVYLKLHI